MVAGDKIGTDVTGEVALVMDNNGVVINSSIGQHDRRDRSPSRATLSLATAMTASRSATASEGNIIAGDNDRDRYHRGKVELGNSTNGVEVDAGCTDNTIGGTASGSGNVISANGEYGIWITGDGETGNLVAR